MKIRNVSQLNQFLSDDLAWRKKELSAYRKLVGRGQDVAVLRGAVTMLYAHWEGFVKNVGTGYLNFIHYQRCRYEELTPNFIALGMKQKLNQATDTGRASIFTEVARFFLAELPRRARLPFKGAVATRSNLTPRVMRDIVCLLGLDYKPYEIKERPIIDRLLHLRNNIAHGKESEVKLPEYERLHSETLLMLRFQGPNR